MFLLRHLLLNITTAIAGLLIAAQALSIDTACQHFDRQLRTQSEAAATRLASAFSRAPSLSEANWRTLAINLFEQGHYSHLRVEGPFTFEYHQAPAAFVSRWFAAIFSLEAAPTTRTFRAVNGIKGTVTVSADTTEAGWVLWRYCLNLAGLVGVIGACWLLSANTQMRGLQKQKRLLHDISVQVRALTRGDANPAALPADLDVADVACALAEVKKQFRITAEETHARLESLQLELNLDAVTRLPNRKYFFNELRRALKGSSTHGHGLPSGYVLMFRQRDLAAINRDKPRDFTDQWLRGVAQRLEQIRRTRLLPLLLARLNGSDFALLLADIPRAQALALAEEVRHELNTLRVALSDQSWCRWALAIAPYQQGQHASELFAILDHTLMQAENTDTTTVLEAEKIPTGKTPGEHQWRDTLMMALQQHRFSLTTQAIEKADGTVLSHEGALMLHDAESSAPINANMFLPPAVRLGFSSECDIQTGRLALDWLVSHPSKLAVPLALPSLRQANFLSRLKQLLCDRPLQAARLVLEIDAPGMVEYFPQVKNLCEVARTAGACIGIRRLAQDFNALRKLHQLPITYVKLDMEFIASIAHSPGSRYLATSVQETARALNIDVYAEKITHAETCKFLDNLGIMTIQPRPTFLEA